MLFCIMTLFNTLLMLCTIKATNTGAQGLVPGMPTTDNSALTRHIEEMKNEAEEAKKNAALECRQSILDKTTTVEGTVQKVDPAEFTACVEAKKKKLFELSKSINALIKNEMGKPIQRPCVVKLDQRSKNCYTKAALKEWLKGARYSLDVIKNVVEIWDTAREKLIAMIVNETPKYELILPPKVCKSFFKRPSYRMDVNRAGDMINSEGKPNEKKTMEKNCRPCSDFTNTTEGAFEACKNTCDPNSIIFTSDSIKPVTKPATKPAKKPEDKTSTTSNDETAAQ